MREDSNPNTKLWLMPIQPQNNKLIELFKALELDKAELLEKLIAEFQARTDTEQRDNLPTEEHRKCLTRKKN